MRTSPPRVERNAAIECLFPDRGAIAFDCRFMAGSSAPPLDPREASAVAGASAERRLEYAVGRGCARAAIEALGHRSPVVPRGIDRAPDWPDGVTGSISHTFGYAVAVAALDTRRPLGVDAELVGAVDDDVANIAFTETERRRGRSLTGVPDDLGRTLMFSAKEALFKAQYPISREWIDFDQVEIVDIVAYGGGTGSVTLEATPPAARMVAVEWPVQALWVVVDDVVIVGTTAHSI